MCSSEYSINRGKVNDLDYVPFVVKAHYREEIREKTEKKMKDLKYPLRIIRDGQGILVEDGVAIFVGEGEEFRFGS